MPNITLTLRHGFTHKIRFGVFIRSQAFPVAVFSSKEHAQRYSDTHWPQESEVRQLSEGAVAAISGKPVLILPLNPPFSSRT